MKPNILDDLNLLVWKLRHKFSPEYEYEYDSQGEVIHNFTPIQWTPDTLISLCISGVCGAFFGVVIAVCINTVLMEVPTSPSFTLYSSIIFIMIGLLILWKVVFPINTQEIMEETLLLRTPRFHLFIFGALNVVAGIFCLFLKRDSMTHFPLVFRFIVYGAIGMSVAFALTYGLVDIINCVVGFFRPGSARPLVESVLQIYIVIISSLFLGLIFGILFSIRDTSSGSLLQNFIEASQEGTKIHFLNYVDQRLCILTGVLWGGLAGVANEYIAKVEVSYNRLDQPVGFDEDI